MVLDRHSDKISAATVTDDFKGLKMVVGQTSEFPLTRENVILLRSGYENLVSIMPQVTAFTL